MAKKTTKAPTEKNPAAVALGRLGGLKGGAARAKALTKKQRSEIAKKAAQKGWAKKPGTRQRTRWSESLRGLARKGSAMNSNTA